MRNTIAAILAISLIATGCTGRSPGFCGNIILDSNEVCDGTNVAGQSCASLGFSEGQLRCSGDCLNFDTSLCCSNQCDTFADSECVDNTYRVCALQENGCLDWTEIDCTEDGNSCFDYGPLALCVGTCEPNCQQLGEMECNGSTIRTCDWVGGCLMWVESSCFPVECGGDPIHCIPSSHGRACDAPYSLDGVTFPHRILGRFASGQFPDPPSCSSTNFHPLFLSFTVTASQPAHISARITDSSTNIAFPSFAAYVSTDATGICDSSTRTELACNADSSSSYSSTIAFDARDYGIQQGDTIYLLAHADEGGFPLTNPTIDLLIADCGAQGLATLTRPPQANAHPDTEIELSVSGEHISMLVGTVELRQNGVILATYDLADHPAQVSVSGSKLRLTPSSGFALGATVEVVYALVTVHCGNPISGTASFTVANSLPPTGESCADPIPLANNGASPVYWYEGNNQDVLSTHTISCLSNSVGGNDVIFSFTMDATATNALITIPKSSNNGIVALVQDSCGPFSWPLACAQDTTHNELTLDAQNLVPGHTYYLVVGASSSQHSFPDPRLTDIHIQQYFSMNLVKETFDTWPAVGWAIEDLGESGEKWVHCPMCVGTDWQTVDHMVIPYGFPPLTIQYDDSLITPSFSTHGFGAVYVEFNFSYWDWLQTGLTEARLEYRVSNGQWTLVKQIGTESSQQYYEFLILPNANNNDNVQVRFRYLSPEKGSDWIIDNVRIFGVP